HAASGTERPQAIATASMQLRHEEKLRNFAPSALNTAASITKEKTTSKRVLTSRNSCSPPALLETRTAITAAVSAAESPIPRKLACFQFIAHNFPLSAGPGTALCLLDARAAGPHPWSDPHHRACGAMRDTITRTISI